MTVQSLTRSQSYAGGQSVLNFNFRTIYNQPSYINVNVVSLTGGAITPLTYNVGYTVTINPSGVGGTVTISPTYSTAYNYVVYRLTPLTQTSAYTDYNSFPASTLENNIDVLTLIDQENSDDYNRSIQIPIGTTPTISTALPIPMPNSVLGWDATGTILTNYNPATLNFIAVSSASTLGVSDGVVPTQHAVKTYVDNNVAISITNPNYGADPTGSKDCTSIIQSALNAGGYVYIPPGTYLITGSSLTVNNNTVLFGAGQGKSILSYSGTGSCIKISNPINSSTHAYISLRNFAVNCTAPTCSALSACIVDVGSTYCHYSDLHLSGNNYGLILDQSEAFVVENTYFDSNLTSGIWLTNGADHTVSASTGYTNVIHIKDCAISTTGIGIVDDGGTQHIYEGINFESNATSIRMAAVNSNTVRNCYFEGNTGNAIEMYATTNVLGTTVTTGSTGVLNFAYNTVSMANSLYTVNVRANTIASLVSIGNGLQYTNSYYYRGCSNLVSFSNNGDTIITGGGLLADYFVYGTGSASVSGWTSSTIVINQEKIGKRVYVDFNVHCTSNSTSSSITLAYLPTSSSVQFVCTKQ